MKRRTGIILAVAALVLTSALTGQEDLSDKVARLAGTAGARAPALSWKIAAELKKLGPDVVVAMKPHLDSGNTTFRIAAASTLIHFGEREAGQKILFDIIGDEDLKYGARRAAAGVLGNQGNLSAADTLKGVMEDTLNPLLKLEIAKALWKLSLNHRPEAKKVFRGFLKSEDPDLQAAGALALAEFDDLDVAKKVLERLKEEPSERGQLARSYLRTYDAYRQLENAFYRNPRHAVRSDKFDLIAEVLQSIKRFHLVGNQRSEEEVIAAGVRGILRSMDPDSTYLTAEQRADLMSGRGGNLADFGAMMGLDWRGVFSVIRPVFGTPAYRAGLRTNDKIIEVDGWSVFDRDLDEILKRTNGAMGTKVKIKVVRRGWKEPRTLSIKRARFKIAPVLWDMLPGKIGFVQIASFSDNTAADLDRALDDLNGKGVKGLILDLRNNHGRILSAAARVVDRFVDKGKLIVYWEGRNQFIAPRQEIRTRMPSRETAYPMAVLINLNTAGAAEVVAGALQFYNRAKIVGKQSSAMGNIQEIRDLVSVQGDRFKDMARKNGIRDSDESFTDLNKNGWYDEGEPFEDRERLNGRWDPGEAFEDLNKNGKYDVGPGIRITIAQYFLPDGRSIQHQVNAEGKITVEGGIKPDVKVDPGEWPSWKEEELAKLIEVETGKSRFRDYVTGHWKEHKDLFERLAVFDGYDTDRYPEFETFLKSLDTRLDRNDVRRWIRIYLRQKVMEVRGRASIGLYVDGDFEEDRQLQRAILEVLKTLEPPVDPGTIEEYKTFPAKVKDTGKGKK